MIMRCCVRRVFKFCENPNILKALPLSSVETESRIRVMNCAKRPVSMTGAPVEGRSSGFQSL
jgi:hypothetical protein